MKLVFATENVGKLSEVRKFAARYGVEILSPSEAGLVPQNVEETGDNYEANARLKVEAYRSQPLAKDLMICADDTGIEIDALHGEPGVHTRRWLGYRMSDDEIVGYTFGRLHEVEDKDRSAHFKITIAYSLYGDDIRFCKGQLDGRIVSKPMLEAPRQEGVPFRKLFIVADGELPLWKFDETPLDRRILSHRETAFDELFKILKKNAKDG
jgi:XTP/dITP diphosphohydrolase